jgi:hypothetical protein
MIGADLVSPVTPLFLGQNFEIADHQRKIFLLPYKITNHQPPVTFFQINDLFF